MILATILLTFSFANAQCKVYSGIGDYGGTQVGYGNGCGNASLSAGLLLLF